MFNFYTAILLMTTIIIFIIFPFSLDETNSHCPATRWEREGQMSSLQVSYSLSCMVKQSNIIYEIFLCGKKEEIKALHT